MQNDEHSHLAILSLKCGSYDSEYESNDSFEGEAFSYIVQFTN